MRFGTGDAVLGHLWSDIPPARPILPEAPLGRRGLQDSGRSRPKQWDHAAAGLSLGENDQLQPFSLGLAPRSGSGARWPNGQKNASYCLHRRLEDASLSDSIP